jgi:hypothetical protein
MKKEVIEQQVLTLASGDFQILTPQEIAGLQINNETRFIVNGSNEPKLLNRKQINERQKKKSDNRGCAMFLLFALALLALLLIWVPITNAWMWLIAIPILIISSLILAIFGYEVEHSWKRLFFALPVILTLLWLFFPTTYTRIAGLTVCGLILLWFIYKNRLPKANFRHLDNSHPRNALNSYYQLLQTIQESGKEGLIADDLKEEAFQYLTLFRQADYVGEGRWKLSPIKSIETIRDEEQIAQEPQSLSSLGQHFYDGNAFDVRSKYFSMNIKEYAFLRPVEIQSNDQVTAYFSMHVSWTEESWTSPTPDWDVRLSDSSYNEIHHYRRVLTKFDDGWFIDNWKHDRWSFRNEDFSKAIKALKEKRLLS